MLCTCLCNKAGHHGICQEKADLKCALAYPEVQLYTPGVMCRRCYEAVVRVAGAALRASNHGPAEAGREVSRRTRDGYGLAQGGVPR